MDDQDDNWQQDVLDRQKVKEGVKSFVRKMQFESYIRSGLTPSDAAIRMGIKIPLGSNLKTAEILKIIEKGNSGRRT